MTGPDHLREAERLRELSADDFARGQADLAEQTRGEALIHAVLALVAAVSELEPVGRLSESRTAWRQAMGPEVDRG